MISGVGVWLFFFLMIRRPPRSTLFPTRRSSDLQISYAGPGALARARLALEIVRERLEIIGDRKSTRLNSSHMSISYAVFCLKKKKKNINEIYMLNKKQNKQKHN